MEEKPRIIDEYIDINSSIVQIQQIGLAKTLVPPQKDCTNYQASVRSDADTPDIVVIFIPGNPGLVGYYHDFNLQLLHNIEKDVEQLERNNNRKKIPIVSLSHNNFDHPPYNHSGNSLHMIRDHSGDGAANHAAAATFDDPSQMELQIRNKVVIIKTLFDLKRTKFIFVGHSIGCYVIMNILQDQDIDSRTVQSFFIHPALENLALTQKGQYWDRVFHYKLDWIIALAALVLDTVVPHSARLHLIRWFKGHGDYKRLSPPVVDAIVQTSSYKALQATTSMAKSEFAKVKDLNVSCFEPIVDKLKIYYAKKDHWVNSNHRVSLKSLFPKLDLEEKDAMHAFVLQPETVSHYASQVARIIAEKISASP